MNSLYSHPHAVSQTSGTAPDTQTLDGNPLLAVDRFPGGVGNAQPPERDTSMNGHPNPSHPVEKDDGMLGGVVGLPSGSGDLWNSELDAFIKGMEQLDLQDTENTENSESGKGKKRPDMSPEPPRAKPPVSQEDRLASIQRCIQSLVHGSQCRDLTCQLPSCQKMKRVLSHTKNCKRKSSGQCPICKQLIQLCCYHAKSCNDSRCLVPFCPQIRAKWKLQRKQQEIQRQQQARYAQLYPPPAGMPAPAGPGLGGDPPRNSPPELRLRIRNMMMGNQELTSDLVKKARMEDGEGSGGGA
ncbi:uncharacterized protein LOC129600499 [Paramacrobiotus metropolitanus]|uniref:uncharacterized protein LOC129600499 n=1 Tax=Paramacrobiotus metropolitanus TaxID=2943436 RepID=UPI0024461BAA|nr:uncharacterized protein LOC129600499 [Paramacrobiotus metropolitanus]